MGHAGQFLATYAISFDVFLSIFFPVDQRNDFSVRLICKGGAKDIKMVRQNRDAAGAEASAESTIIEAP